jgi:hypothetical protein
MKGWIRTSSVNIRTGKMSRNANTRNEYATLVTQELGWGFHRYFMYAFQRKPGVEEKEKWGL